VETTELIKFDFEVHKKSAVEQYQKVYPLYAAFSENIRSILEKSLNVAGIRYQSIEARPKDVEKFGEKASKPSLENPNEPKYKNPLNDITDLTGALILPFSPKQLLKLIKY
jgi:putative GTP pyrophosphokinase